MGLTKPIEQYLFSNLLIRIHVFMYLKDIIRVKDYEGCRVAVNCLFSYPSKAFGSALYEKSRKAYMGM